MALLVLTFPLNPGKGVERLKVVVVVVLLLGIPERELKVPSRTLYSGDAGRNPGKGVERVALFSFMDDEEVGIPERELKVTASRSRSIRR